MEESLGVSEWGQRHSSSLCNDKRELFRRDRREAEEDAVAAARVAEALRTLDQRMRRAEEALRVARHRAAAPVRAETASAASLAALVAKFAR